MEFHRKRKIESTIDMTPMIDTLLQLFVTFMLCMSFASSAVHLSLPQAAANENRPTVPVVVSLDADNRMHLNNTSIAPSELPARLTPLFEQNGKREVILRADESLPYKHVLRAMGTIRQAGATDIHLAYDPEKP